MSAWLGAILLWQGAMAREPIERSIHIDASPEVVAELITDLESWAEWANIGSDDKLAQVAIRGTSGQRGQSLRWYGAGQGAGKITVVEVDERHLSFELVRFVPAGFGVDSWTRWRQTTYLSWEAVDGGTRLTWAPRIQNITAGEVSVQRSVDAVLAQLKSAAEEHPPDLVRPATERAASDKLLLWQGFEQEWTYNHRINRLGSWVTPPACTEEAGCSAEIAHAAASGSGADQARVRDLGEWVSAPGLDVQYGMSTLWFTGREGEQLQDAECIPMPGSGAAVLEGFDIKALRSAHSLWGMAFQVEHEEVEGVEVLCVSGELQMACRTAECRRDRFTEYVVEVRWAWVTAPGLHVTDHVLPAHAYAWEAETLLDMVKFRDHMLDVELVGIEGPPLATAGLSRVGVQLSAPLHTRGLALALHPGDYDPEAGRLAAKAHLLYQQWGPVEIAPLTVAQFSKHGEVELSAEVVLLQLDEGCTEPVSFDGSVYWHGGGADGRGDDAVTLTEVVLGCDEPAVVGDD
ncbi:MAG: hypothetical protein EP330_01890 [Deltaproteobacteria bacterium]|nr:MAG: hypothetical protein EP330_01890 [Deltaproteobacteria bacterium]